MKTQIEPTEVGTINSLRAKATPQETRQEMLRLSARGYVQIRQILVQLPDREKERSSVISPIVSQRKHRALILYLLLLTCWPWLAERKLPLQSEVWIRALSTDRGLTWTGPTLSRAWQDLEMLGLVTREREERLLRVKPRREDGCEEYDPPAGRRDRWNTYFIIPDRFWTDELFATLSLPALVMLLVVAKETNKNAECWLTYDNCEEWYGLKSQTVRKGVKELEEKELLHRRPESVVAPLSPTGMTTRMWYSLTGDFGSESRRALRNKAVSEMGIRLNKKSVRGKEVSV
ncbi:hypothetical protein V5R04_02490 [Jonesiaceae bacterium BS-20]|uniref:Uncharacterized protein n=1 Tax=Jonesiaceae bacterium BS-20 TaxID=3120821 RepID=A0AAU7DWA1_9MICO